MGKHNFNKNRLKREKKAKSKKNINIYNIKDNLFTENHPHEPGVSYIYYLKPVKGKFNKIKPTLPSARPFFSPQHQLLVPSQLTMSQSPSHFLPSPEHHRADAGEMRGVQAQKQNPGDNRQSRGPLAKITTGRHMLIYKVYLLRHIPLLTLLNTFLQASRKIKPLFIN